MLSPQAQELFEEMRRTNSEDTESFDLEEERLNSSQAGDLTIEPQGVTYETTTIANLQTIIARPKIMKPSRTLIFLHGGAYVMMSPETHRKFAGHIATACHAETYIPQYSLAPECPFPTALEEIVAFTRAFTESNELKNTNIMLSGDSAGGGLALSVAMKMRDDGLKLPASLILLCPWLDLSLASDSVNDNRDNAIILKKHKLEHFANLYVNDSADKTHPYVSPIYGDLAGLPPIYIQGAEYDLLVGDAIRLQIRMRDLSIPIQFDLFPQMVHSFQFFAGQFPEADMAIVEISSYLDSI